MIRLSGRIVATSLPPLPQCAIAVRSDNDETIRINFVSCAYRKIDTGIAQGATRVINFVDADTVDYSGVAEITVDVWQNNVNGVNILSKSLTGGSVTVYDDNAFRIVVDAAESEDFPAGCHHIEVWITRTDTTRRLVGMGTFTVADTRKYD